MNCDVRKEQVSRFIDGELEGFEHAELFRHLAECPDCQLFFETLLKVSEFGKREQIAFPLELDDTILESMTSGKPHHRSTQSDLLSRRMFWKRRITLPVPIAVVVIIILVVLSIVLGSSLRNGSREHNVQQTSISDSHSGRRSNSVVLVYGIPEVEVLGHQLTKMKNN